jgi:uncharacterized protein YfaS (alpha-2-macroglobulin family)
MKSKGLTAKLLAIVFIAFLFVSAKNETIIVRGKVTDSTDGKPVAGCSVTEKKGKSGKSVVTDTDGNYSFETEKGKTLVFSRIGYKEKKVKVKDTILNVVLEPEDFSIVEEEAMVS